MKRLRIVLVMLEPPLPFGNAAARWYYVLLRGLVERGHEVVAFATCSKPEEVAKAQALFPATGYDLRCYLHSRRCGVLSKWETLRRPYSYMFSPEMRCDVEGELGQGFDILHLEHLWAGWLGLHHLDRALMNVHYLGWIDMEQTRPATWRERWNKYCRRATEERLVRAFTHFRSGSPRLVPELQRVNPDAQVTTVPLGIDPAQYEYIPQIRRPTVPVVSLIGSMDWYPTWSAAMRMFTRLWPAIKARVPEARLQVVGWNARTALKEFLAMPDVVIEENVPDIRPYFEKTGVLLYAPARGSGMKIKIMEALGFGVPVVTTSEGVEGLPAADGIHAGICEDDAGLIERTVRLLRDPALQERQRAAGRALLEDHCGPRTTLDALESIYRKMTHAI